MDRARTLAAQGANFTMDASGRQSLADEIQSLLEQMVTISRTTVQGRYVFGGDRIPPRPTTLDLTAANGVARLTNAAADAPRGRCLRKFLRRRQNARISSTRATPTIPSRPATSSPR